MTVTDFGVRSAMSVGVSGSRRDRDTEVKSAVEKPRSSSAAATVGAVVQTKRCAPLTSSLQQPAALEHDRRAVVDGGGQAGRDQVVRVRVIARVVQHGVDVGRGGVDDPNLAVDHQMDRLVARRRGEGDRAADHPSEYGPVEAVLDAAKQDRDS